MGNGVDLEDVVLSSLGSAGAYENAGELGERGKIEATGYEPFEPKSGDRQHQNVGTGVDVEERGGAQPEMRERDNRLRAIRAREGGETA